MIKLDILHWEIAGLPQDYFLHLLNKAKEKNITTASGLLKLCNQGTKLHHLIRNAKKIH